MGPQGLHIPIRHIKVPRWEPFPLVRRERREIALVLANYRVEPTGSRPLAHVTNKKKRPLGGFFICGGTTGTRTLDPMIKSHLLYQLSYGPMDPERESTSAIFRWVGLNSDTIKTKMQEKMQKIQFPLNYIRTNLVVCFDSLCTIDIP